MLGRPILAFFDKHALEVDIAPYRVFEKIFEKVVDELRALLVALVAHFAFREFSFRSIGLEERLRTSETISFSIRDSFAPYSMMFLPARETRVIPTSSASFSLVRSMQCRCPQAMTRTGSPSSQSPA